MAETQVLGWGTANAPSQRTTKGTEKFVVLAVNATFDGTASASSFLPCVEIISDAGQVVSRNIADTSVGAGGSAEVTFAPFLSTGGSSDAADELHWGSNTDSLSEGLTLNAQGDVSILDPAHAITLQAFSGINVDATFGQLELQNVHMTWVTDASGNSTWTGPGVYTYNISSSFLVNTADSFEVDAHVAGHATIYTKNDVELHSKQGMIVARLDAGTAHAFEVLDDVNTVLFQAWQDGRIFGTFDGGSP